MSSCAWQALQGPVCANLICEPWHREQVLVQVYREKYKEDSNNGADSISALRLLQT